jgi:hypothetical protein
VGSEYGDAPEISVIEDFDVIAGGMFEEEEFKSSMQELMR